MLTLLLEMYQFLLNHKSKLLVLITVLLSSCCKGTSITLSPLGVVSVCPGGQILLTCERMNGSLLFWDVSVPHLPMSRESIVANQGVINTVDLQFNELYFTEFNVTRTSISPLISQLLISNVTTEINGSTIYCSEDENENEAPAVAVNVKFYNDLECSLSGVTTTISKYADCGVPVSNATLNYDSSTLERSVLILTCENDTSTDEQTLSVTCHSNGSWIPDPADFTCSSFNNTTAPSGTQDSSKTNVDQSLGVIIGSVVGVLMIAAAATTVGVLAILCFIKGYLNPKRVNRLPDIQLENPYAEQNSPGQADPVVQQDTPVYADIGPSPVNKRTKQLRPDDIDDRVEYAVLKQKPATQDSIADDSLNLDTLLIQVQGAVTPHWYQLGQALKVSKDVLDRCSNYPPEESIVEVLDQWLRNFPGRPTWRDVANALRRIGFQQLANDIEMVYETGKLPIAIAHQVFTTTALELPHNEEEKQKITFNNNQDESAPPLPPKPLAESDHMVPPRPPK